jgi:hypothetical protein
MKRWIFRGVLLVGLIALSLWVRHVWFPSPDQAIRRQLADLARAASIAPNETAVAQLYNSQKLAGFFTSDVHVRIDVPGHSQTTLTGREEVMAAARAARSVASNLKVEFIDINVVLDPDRKAATANLTARGDIPGDKFFLMQELSLRIKNIQGDWLISRAETVKTLR